MTKIKATTTGQTKRLNNWVRVDEVSHIIGPIGPLNIEAL